MIKSFEEREEEAIAAFRQKMEAAVAVLRSQRRREIQISAVSAATVALLQIVAGNLVGGKFNLTICAITATVAWFTAFAFRSDPLPRAVDIHDPRLIGGIAEYMQHRQKDVRLAAERSARRLLTKTKAEHGGFLTPKSLDGLQTLLRSGYTKEQAVAALNLLSQRHEQRAREIAESLIRFPASCFPHRLKPEEAAEVKEAAKRTLEAIDANRERVQLQETLLRPSEDAEVSGLLRPATGTGVPEEQLLRPGAPGDE
jgi:hypothetical protein